MLWWHWVVIGIVLILSELVVPSFTIFWFGLGAVLTGVALTFVDLSLEAQLGVFCASSIAFTALWFWWFRPRLASESVLVDESEVIGETGVVASAAKTPGDIGRVNFSAPVMGQEIWDCVSDEPIELGNRVRITAVIVEKKDKEADARRILKVEKVF